MIIDTQSVRAAAGVPKTTTGLDANKKVVEVVRRNPADQGKGFVPQPKRWIVEQVNGTLMLHRRLAREYDHRPDTSASRVYWASIANMARRLTTPAPSWRDALGLAA